MSARWLRGQRWRERYNVIHRMKGYVKSGLIETPPWWTTLKMFPPQARRPRTGLETKEIVYPTDRLVQVHQRKNPHVLLEPLHMGPGGLPSLSYIFANRQLALIQSGLSEADAYEKVEADMSAEREEGINKVKALVELAKKETGAEPSFISSKRAQTELMHWRDMMGEIPYLEWEDGPRASLDHWLQKRVMKWSEVDIKHARTVEDETYDRLEEETEALKHALFPETIPEVREWAPAVDWEQQQLWGDQYASFQESAKENGDWSEWPPEHQDALYRWIMEHVLTMQSFDEVTTNMDEGDRLAAQALYGEKWQLLLLDDRIMTVIRELFPELKVPASRQGLEKGWLRDQQAEEREKRGETWNEEEIKHQRACREELLKGAKKLRRYQMNEARLRWEQEQRDIRLRAAGAEPSKVAHWQL
ncbi:unnamed protein product [Chrysoparadoxa australica]